MKKIEDIIHMTEAIIQKRDLFKNVKSLKEYSEFYEKSFLQYIDKFRVRWYNCKYNYFLNIYDNNNFFDMEND